LISNDLHQILVVRPEAKERVLALLERVFAGDSDFDTVVKFRTKVGSDLLCVIEGEFLNPWRDSLFGILEGIMVLPRDKAKYWSGEAFLYETETDLGFAPGITLPEDFPWPCENQRVKVTLELVQE